MSQRVAAIATPLGRAARTVGAALQPVRRKLLVSVAARVTGAVILTPRSWWRDGAQLIARPGLVVGAGAASGRRTDVPRAAHGTVVEPQRQQPAAACRGASAAVRARGVLLLIAVAAAAAALDAEGVSSADRKAYRIYADRLRLAVQLTALPPDSRPGLPDLTKYDALLQQVTP